MVKCPECGSENNDSSKFCKSCGAKLTSHDDLKIIANNKNKGKDDKTKLIIGGLVIVVAILAIILLYAGGVFGSNVPLETQEFEGFKMDVPTDSKYVLDESFTKNKKSIYVGYLNDGKDIDKAGAFSVGNNLSEKTISKLGKLEETDGDVKVYKNDTDGETTYIVFKEGKDANVAIYGTDANTMKRMAATFEDKDFKKLYQKSSDPTTPTANTQQTAAPAAPATTAMSILGGSFSTGGGLEDKTYASIFVGPEHAGENVIIQIFYSRDGSALDNGNMVPKTVDSSGYIEVASAEPYSKFPDFAEINLYDSSSKLLDTYSVSLNPDSGTQTF